MRTSIKIGIAILLAPMVLIALPLLVIITTETGSVWLVKQSLPFVPGEMRVEHVQGRLMGPLTLQGIRYQATAIDQPNRGSNPGLQFKLARMDFDWRVLSLLSGQVNITQLHVDGFTLSLPPQPESATQGAIQTPHIKLPITISLQNFLATRIEIQQGPGAPATPIDEIQLDVRAGGDTLSIQAFNVKTPLVAAKLSGTCSLREALPVNLKVDWEGRWSEQAQWHGAAKLTGTMAKYQLEHTLSAPFQAQTRAMIVQPIKALRWNLTTRFSGLNQQVYALESLTYRLAGEIRADGDIRKQNMALDVQGQVEEYGKIETALKAKRDGDRVQVESLTFTAPEHGSTLNAKGLLSLQQPFHVDGVVEWQKLQWPLTGTPQIKTNQGVAGIRGTLAAYEIEAELDAAGENIPETHLKLAGKGSDQQIQLDKINADLLAGTIQANAKIKWKPKLDWQTEVTAKNINPGKQWSEWPGLLALSMQSTGVVDNQGMRFMMDLGALKGRLRGRDVFAQMQLTQNQQQLNLKRLTLRSGKALLSAQGTKDADERLDVEWRVNAPNLADLLPDASGVLQIEGNARGTLQQPAVIAKIVGDDIHTETLSIAKFNANTTIDWSDKQVSRADIQAQEVIFNHKRLGAMSAKLRGLLSKHNISFLQNSKNYQSELTMEGGYKDGVWSAILNTAEMTTPRLGAWKLEQPLPVRASATQFSLERGCLANTDAAQICAQAVWQSAAPGQAQLELKAFPLRSIAGLLPPQLQVTGMLGGNVRLAWTEQNLQQLDASLEARPGKIKFIVGANEEHVWRYQSITMDMKKSNQEIISTFNFQVPKQAELQAQVTLPVPSLQWEVIKTQPLNGQISGKINDLVWLKAFAPQLQEIKGEAHVDMALLGTVATPDAKGSAEVSNMSLRVADFGLHLRNTQLKLTTHQDEQIQFVGKSDSGEGQVNYNGYLKRSTKLGWVAKLILQGDRYEVINNADAWVQISPNLEFDVIPGRIDLNGTLHIPQGRYELREIKQTITASEDVKIIDEEVDQEQPQKWKLHTHIRITMADNFRVKGFGFDGRIGGDLIIMEQPQKLTTARGKLDIVSGEYTAYGQDLVVESGRLLFANAPVDNPGLDLRAVRTIGVDDPVKIFVLVRGTLKTPEITLDSQPPMDQVNRLSYLVLGGPASEASKSDQQRLQDTAAAKGENVLAGWIGKQLGLEELAVLPEEEREQGGSTRPVLLGKYLSPRLYLSTIIGTASDVPTVRIRYKLSGKWDVEAESGEHSGGDIFYTIER